MLLRCVFVGVGAVVLRENCIISVFYHPIIIIVVFISGATTIIRFSFYRAQIVRMHSANEAR